MNETLLAIHRLIRRLQQKNRFIGRVRHSGLTLAETHFILELHADSSRGVSDLAAILRVDQSSCSRIAQGLVKQDLLGVSPSAEDSRRKNLHITLKGKALIEKIDATSHELIANYINRISKSEIKTLVKFLRKIADGYGHPPGIRRPHELEYRVEQRRITRCFGLLGDNAFESGFNSSQWQALSEIVYSPVALQTTELSQLLGLAQNSLSPILDMLVKRKLITRERSAEDRRVIYLKVRDAGVRICRAIEKKAVLDLRRCFVGTGASQIEEVANILSRFVGENNSLLPPLLPGYQVEELNGADQMAPARGIALRSLLSQGYENQIPETTIAKSSRNFALYLDDDLIAVLEFSVVDDPPQLIFAGWLDEVSPWILASFINAAHFMMLQGRSVPFASNISFLPLRSFLGL